MEILCRSQRWARSARDMLVMLVLTLACRGTPATTRAPIGPEEPAPAGPGTAEARQADASPQVAGRDTASAQPLGDVAPPTPPPATAALPIEEVGASDAEHKELPPPEAARDQRPLSRREVDSIKRAMIQASIDDYDGPCPCPFNTARNGSRCGRRSAYNRPGGESPLCFPSDITEAMVRDFNAAPSAEAGKKSPKKSVKP
jgi:hypothetical protein